MALVVVVSSAVIYKSSALVLKNMDFQSVSLISAQ
jgi:hypothetical protein